MNWIENLNSALEKLASLAGQHAKIVVSVFIGLILVGAAMAGLGHQKNSKETQAFVEFSTLEKDFNNWKLAMSPQPPGQTADKTPKVDPQDLFTKLTKFIDAKGDLKASQMAALMAADLGNTLNKDSEVLDLIQKKLKNSGSSLLNGLALLKQGDLLVNSDKCDQAITVWTKLSKGQTWSYLQDFAHLKMGLCYEKLAQNDQAQVQYEMILKAKDSKTDRWAYKEAQKYKRALTWSN